MNRKCLSIILAAGEGTRMCSSLPKVLHKIAGLALVNHVVDQMQASGADKIAVVVGHAAESVVQAVSTFMPDVSFFYQEKPQGTAHAVLVARAALESGIDDILIAFADMPLIEASYVQKVRSMLAEGADIVVTGFHCNDPTGYGRLIVKDEQLQAIIEDKDASPVEKTIQFCNGGLMALSGRYALSLLEQVSNENAKGEYYLTDIVKIAVAQGHRVQALEVPFEQAMGVNNRYELAQAQALWQKRKARAVMLTGVTLEAPESVYFSYDTMICRDAVIEPHVYFGVGVEVGEGAHIRAFSHLEGTIVGPASVVGPYARLRPGTILAESAKIGNFCEIKGAQIGVGAKVNHLSYIGDATIGAHANIGAGTITCNYDGYNKWKTEIGAHAFIGSNSALVAPVSIGARAYVASGSVITNAVPQDALAIARAQQVIKEQRAVCLRKKFSAIKDKKL